MTDFDSGVAIRYAQAVVHQRATEDQEAIRTKADIAAQAAFDYGRGLELGHPADLFPEHEGDASYYRVALQAVYRAWDDARGSRNPFTPLDSGGAWRLAEHFLANIGTPFKYAGLAEVYWGRAFGRSNTGTLDPNQIAKILTQLQGDDLVVRRLKLDGKVAWILRERQEGEEPNTAHWAADIANDPAQSTVKR